MQLFFAHMHAINWMLSHNSLFIIHQVIGVIQCESKTKLPYESLQFLEIFSDMAFTSASQIISNVCNICLSKNVLN